MAEYIQREELLELFQKHRQTSCMKYFQNDYGVGLRDAFERLDQIVRDAPSADVAPVVHGRWEYLECDWFCLWRCTACGDEWTFEYDPTDDNSKVHYCPHCGARMDGGNE